MRRIVHLAASLILLLAVSAGFTGAQAQAASGAPAAEEAVPLNAYQAAETFLRHLRKGEFAKAYAMSTPELQGIITADAFRKQVQLFQQTGMQTVRWHSLKATMKLIDFQPGKGLRWNVTTNQFQGQLTTLRNGELTLSFNWINEDGTWRMLAFRWDQVAKTSEAR